MIARAVVSGRRRGLARRLAFRSSCRCTTRAPGSFASMNGVQPWRAGQVRMLSIGSAQRLPRIPEVPTTAEGGLPGYEAITWFGLFTTGGTPRAIVEKLNTEVQRIFADAGFREKFLAPSMFESIAARIGCSVR